MELDPKQLKNKPTGEIVQSLLRYVTKSEEELQREKEEERKRTTDLKVFISRKDGFVLGTIERQLQNLASNPETHQYTRDFINDHGFSEVSLNESVSYLEIRTPSYERSDQAILVDTGEYVRTLTIERRYWTKRTIEKVLDYLPGLSRLYLTADDISEIVKSLNNITETNVSGFTSKRRSYEDDRRISIQFHGGDEDDIVHVKEEFDAKPTRVEFRQKNSPIDAVTGAVTRNARINVPGIKAGSEALGEATIRAVADEFEQFDQEHFNVPNVPKIKSFEEGLVIEGFTTIRLVDEDQQAAATDGGKPEEEASETIQESLVEDIFESKRRYDFQEWVSNDFLLLDKERNEIFQVGIDGNDLIVNARPGTTPITLKEFCRIILQEFKTTYGISQRTTDLLHTE